MSLRPFSFRNFRSGPSNLSWTASVWKDNKRIAKLEYANPARYWMNKGDDGLTIYDASRHFSLEERQELIILGNDCTSWLGSRWDFKIVSPAKIFCKG